MKKKPIKSTLTLIRDVARMKKSLIEKLNKQGLYENFGEKEVRKLKDKYSDFCYGDIAQRMVWKEIERFDDWCGRATDGNSQ